MENKTVKILIVAACAAVPFCGAELLAKEHHHHRKPNVAAEIIDAVARLVNPRPVVVTPAPAPVVVTPAPAPVVVVPPPPRRVHHRPAPPPPRHHAPAPHPAGRGGHHR